MSTAETKAAIKRAVFLRKGEFVYRDAYTVVLIVDAKFDRETSKATCKAQSVTANTIHLAQLIEANAMRDYLSNRDRKEGSLLLTASCCEAALRNTLRKRRLQ